MTNSRPPVHASPTRRKRARLFRSAAVALAALLLVLLWAMQKDDAAPFASKPTPEARQEPGPPWRAGPANARFIIVLYADMECPYCKAYYPALKAWVAGQSEASLQWQHLPLPAHEPAATALAIFAECFGETSGHAGFFEAVGWLYQHTRSDGQGLPDGLRHPRMTPAVQACLDSGRPQAIVRTQAEEGAHAGVTATPSLRLIDRQTGESLLLRGPVEGDALLSAMDLLLADATAPARSVEAPTIGGGGTPR
ncbi:MAG: thioredoxin domain-containing protein [Dechloromonas agitata]|uniref:Thioredoxin domain-containing protein n=1 Tax=Dechloromonas agitata TaxID=73030 RepID=A0A930BYM1_9RHOO|nr:thioredoxin domain-containing protein [Dechloromonas agitata]